MDRGQRMAERPLLLFPRPDEAPRGRLHSGFDHFSLPTHMRQGERLSPMLDELWKQFVTRCAEMPYTIPEALPQQTLVIETIGSVEDFANAVRRIDGMEWMAEFDIDDITPDADFHDELNPEKRLDGRMYLIMTNQRALMKVLSLWRSYKDNGGFDSGYGLARFRKVFGQLKSIRLWGVEDTYQETGIVEALDSHLKLHSDKPIRLEVELWFHRGVTTRQASKERVAKLLEEHDSKILCESFIEDIAYHGLLVDLSAHAAQSIVDNPSGELKGYHDVMYFRPRGQMMVGPNPVEGESSPVTEGQLSGMVGTNPAEGAPLANSYLEEASMPAGDPVVALFDGYPLENHAWLAGRLNIDDPDGWAEAYDNPRKRVHGTSMASLIIHGDRNERGTPLASPLYIRPIMKPVPCIHESFIEEVPDDCLVVDLIHRAVRKMCERDAAEPPSAPGVRVINLSIGDQGRPFTRSMSPLARLLDYLSAKHGVLFVISAGNYDQPVSVGASRSAFVAQQPDEREAAIVKALYRDASRRRLLSPAESINGLTVGAVHDDTSNWQPPTNMLDPFVMALPSPVSAFGSGYRRAIKPDIVFSGGRVPFQEKYDPPANGDYRIEPITIPTRSRPPGTKSATPGGQLGAVSDFCYSCGTSNATALISHAAGLCCQSLRQILHAQTVDADCSAFEAPLVKAMLVHTSSWNDTGDRIARILRRPDNEGQLGGLVSRWMGYGTPEIGRVLDCTEQRATLLGYGRLGEDRAHVYRLPLPPSLGSSPVKRRLIVTLAWLSPIAPNTQKYRVASMWFQVGGIPLTPYRQGACQGRGWQAVRRGTLQHEVFEGEAAEPFVDSDEITITVNCRGDAGRVLTPVPYGIVVSLEVAEGTDIAIYDEIRTRIAPRVLIQPAAEDHRE